MTATDIKKCHDGIEDCAAGIIWASVYSVYSSYQCRAREAGKVVLEIEDFWNRFRRRFPGSYWAWADYGADYGQSCIGRAVYVCLRSTDMALAGNIDKWGWFRGEGHDAVLDAFIEEQDLFSGAPHPGDDRSAEWFLQNLLSGNMR